MNSEEGEKRKEVGFSASLSENVDEIADRIYKKIVLWCSDFKEFKKQFPNRRPDPRGIPFHLDRIRSLGAGHPLWELVGDGWAAAIPRLQMRGMVKSVQDGDILYLLPSLTGDSAGQSPHTKKPDDTEKFVFQSQGNTWVIAFNGKRVSGIKDSVAIRRVHCLLRRPNAPVPIPARQLEDISPGGETGDPIDEGAPTGTGQSFQEILDDQALQDIRERQREIDRDIEQAKEGQDHRRQGELEVEKEKLLKELQESHTPTGRRRGLGQSPEARTADTVKRSFRRFYDDLVELGLPEAAQHLKDSIRRESNSFAYRPVEAPTWWL